MMKKLIFYLLTAVCALLYAPPAQAWTIYLDPANVGDDPLVYLYGGGGEVAAWASKPTMKKAADGRWYYDSDLAYSAYSYDKSKTPGYVIFVKSNGTQSSGDNACIFNDGYTYTWDGTGNSTPTSSKWNEYTVYFDNSAVAVADLPFSGWNPPKVYYNDTHNNMTVKDGNIYTYTIAAPSTPTIKFTDGNINSYGNDGHNTVDVNVTDGYIYKIDGKNSSYVYTVTGSVYNPVSITSVEFLKDGESVNTDTEAPYSYQFSELAGTEKFLIKVNYDDKSSKTYTVSSGTNLTEGTTGFSLDSKIINTIMIVNFDGTTATSYSLNATVNDAVTGVYLGSTKMSGSGAKYTLSGVTNSTTGYTVKVTTSRNTDGVTYTVANGSNLLAGTHSLSAGSSNFTVSTTIPTFNVEVAMNTETLVPTSVTIADPNAVITAVSIISHDGSENYVLTSSDGGTTWTGHSKVKAYDGNNISLTDDYGKTAAYHIEVNNAGTTEKWAYSSSNYGMTAGNTYSTTWKKVTGDEFFRFANAGNVDEYTFTVTLSSDKKSIASFKYEKYVAPPTPAATVHMPLTKADFANGPRYFLVGTRMGDWRLQPEWELHVNGNTATLSGRLMYKGMFGVAKVDTYEDYIYHKYTLYTNNGWYVKSAARNDINLGDSRSAQAIRYDDSDTKGQFNTSNTMIWDSEGNGWSSDNVKASAPALLQNVKLELSNGTPSKISFTYTTDVAAARTFSLVGSNFEYQGDCTLFSDGIGRKIKELTPSNLNNKSSQLTSITGWGAGWVLFDDNGAPYVDAYGNVMFCTAYDNDWLSTHPVQFYNTEKSLSYSSLNTVFKPTSSMSDSELATDPYADYYKAHPKEDSYGSDRIGGKSGSRVGDAITLPHGAGTLYEEMADCTNNYYHDSSAWQCYVVKDMWVYGRFKVWAGWGGNIKVCDGVDDGSSENAERWNFENGGHKNGGSTYNVNGYDPTLCDTSGNPFKVYGTTRDIDGADFNVANDWTYFSRVILWYDPSKGMDSAVLQLIRANYGPNIMAFHNTGGKRNTLRYEWWIDAQDTSADDYTITGYKIYRYKVVEGHDTEETLVNDVTNYNQYIKDRKTALNELDDEHSLPAGIYRYKIVATFDTPDGDAEKTAYSNTVTIYEASVPVTMSVEQQMEGDNYTFNLEYKAEPVDEKLSATFGDGTVADAMKYYVITVDDATATRLNNAKSKPFSFIQVTTESIYLSDATKLAAGTWYYQVEITDKNNAALDYVWSGITPNSNGTGALKRWNADKTALIDLSATDAATYSFTTYLVSADSDIAEWALLNFDAASGNTDIVAPAANLAVTGINLVKANGSAFTHDPMTTTTHTDHPSGTRLLDIADVDNKYKIVNRIVYKRLNEVVAPAEISALNVTSQVATDNTVTYNVYLAPEDTDISKNYANKKYASALTPTSPTEATSIKFYDPDISDMNTCKAIDGSHESVIAGDQLSYFDSHILTTYKVGDEFFVNDRGAADTGIEFNPNIEAPSVSVYDKAYAKYESQYYHNGDAEHCNPDHDPCECGQCTSPYTESLGYYAHGAVSFSISGIDNDSKNGFVAFHAQQPVLSDPQYNGGCYAEINDWYKHSFASTRAANGGAPLTDWGSGLTDRVYPLRHDGVNYTECDEDSEWCDANDWSTLAVKSGRLPLHINPVFEYTDKDAYEKNTVNNAQPITAKFAAIYPIVKTDKLSVEVLPAAATMADDDNAASLVRDFDSIYLMGTDTSINVTDWKSDEMMTGVDEIIAGGEDAPVEYYNLQGIRVMNPAKGQIYIVRQGTKVSKTLLK